ncbi:MAG TPA: threonine ammonia-lyase [Longimicrobiaceae bacterium]|nr:threonine ammonia-lyase [Longimicrobiaceae bacterium]
MVRLDDIREAGRRIAGELMLTPCTRSEVFADCFEGQLWFKLENLQRTGSFKERGALNRMLAIPAAERSRGVIAASAGNHAQGVACHATRLGIPSTIVMPERTPLIKVSNTQRFGARVVLHGRNYDEALEEALRLRDAEGATLVHAFDDPQVIAGQGTIGLELLDQVPELEVVIVPVGGGGLVAGIATALKELRPEVRVIGVEAAAVPAALRAREAGELVTIAPGETIAEGISVRRIGELTFERIERYVDELVTVDEEEIASAVLLLLEREKTVAEGAGAASLAALIYGHIPEAAGRNVVVVIGGGNIDVNLLSRIIDRGLIKDGRLVHLRVRVEDRPGALAALTALLAERGANVLELDHRRGTRGLWLTEAEVALRLETRGRSHVRELIDALNEQGYRVREE